MLQDLDLRFSAEAMGALRTLEIQAWGPQKSLGR